MTISVLGCGAWGTALAAMLARQNRGIILWGRDENTVQQINQEKRNRAYLGDIKLPNELLATTNLAHACEAKIILCVTPAQSFSSIAPQIKPLIKANTKLVLCAKGIDQQSGHLLHQLAETHFDKRNIAALSGPSFARDVALGLPTAVSLAAHKVNDAKELAKKISAPRFRIYSSDDMIGVEAGGALKNIMALAVGAARGLKLGASAEAALIARGFAELNRLAVALGGQQETMAGLSGLGDLVLTCSSPQSRNFSYGVALAKDEGFKDHPLAEGVHTTKIALNLARRHQVDVPIIEMVDQVLSNTITAQEAVNLLLSRPLKTE